MTWLRPLLLAAAMALSAAGAQAGRSCEAKAPEAASVERAMNLALATARALDATGAEVVVLARAGQDLRRYGLRYSHLGFAYRDRPPGPQGVPGTLARGPQAQPVRQRAGGAVPPGSG